MPNKNQHYGSKYWCVTGEGDPLYLFADELVVGPSGALLAMGGWRQDKDAPKPDGEPHILFVIASGQWETALACSMLTGGAVCTDSDD